MIQRKLVQHGQSTLMLSLPRKWLFQNNLEKGDTINIIESNNALILNGSAKYEKKEITISITSTLESSIRAILKNLYRLGFSKIHINISHQDMVQTIEKEVKDNLIGFEVMSSNSKLCIIENILEPSKTQLSNIESKIFLNIELLLNSINVNSYPNIQNVEAQIQSFESFCRRVLYQEKTDVAKLQADFLSGIYHSQRELYKAILNIEEATPLMKEAIEDIRAIFVMVRDTRKKQNLTLIEDIHKKEDKLTKKYIDKLKQTADAKEKLFLHKALSTIRQFYLATSPLIGLSVLYATEKEEI